MQLSKGLRNPRGITTILGTMEFGRRTNQEESSQMVDYFLAKKFLEVDTAAMYSGGQTEEFLGHMSNWKDNNMVMATKINPWGKNNLTAHGCQTQTEACLKRLQVDSVDIMYLHAPDHKTKLTETLKKMNDMHKNGQFKELGLSNYSAWQVAEVYNICKANNYVLPTVYQGMYSALTRQVEKELFPCLEYYKIRFYAYSPLGGGILTGKWKITDADAENMKDQKYSRFFSGGKQNAEMWAKIYRERYWKTEYFDGIDNLKFILNEIYGENKVSVPEAAYRWLYHHSALKENDAVIVGASSLEQLKMNLAYTDLAPLDEKVVAFFEKWWKDTAHLCPDYSR